MIRLEIEPSKSKYIDSSKDVALLSKIRVAFTYTNTSAKYQLRDFIAKKQWYLKRLVKEGSSQALAEATYETERQQLEALVVVTLLEEVGGYALYPTGLTERLVEIIRLHGKTPTITDLRVKPKSTPGYPVITKLATLRAYQDRQLGVCLSRHQGTVESATGTGKTVVIQELIRRLGVPTLIVVPNLSILDQTMERFEAYFGKGKVGKYGDGVKKIRKITIACAPSILTSETEDWDDRQLLIFDECHHVACATIEEICYVKVPKAFYRYGFTATPYRADGADLAIEAAVFPVIDSYPIQEGIRDGHLAKPHFVMVQYGESTSDYGKDDRLKQFQNHVIRNSFLNKIVVEQATTVLALGKQVLILVKEKEHGHILAELLRDSVFVRTKETAEDLEKMKKLGVTVAPFTDPSDAVKEFNKGNLRCLIGTSVIGEGTDILPVDVLFLLTGGSSRGNLMQNVGRGLRKVGPKDSVLVFDYMPVIKNSIGYTLSEILERQALKRLEYLNEIEPVKLLFK